VLDFTSGLLFFELSEEFKLDFDSFFISENLLSMIDELIAKTELMSSSDMALNIHDNRVIPTFFPKDYHKQRKKKLLDIKSWFERNTIAEIPKEKINLVRSLYKENKITPGFDLVLDSSLLAGIEESLIITDDIFFNKFLNENNIISTEYYLLNRFPELKNKILAYMLYNKYLGISLDSDVLYDSYINQHNSGYEHVYNYAISNISLKANFRESNILVVIDFLKKLALHPVITKEKFAREATHLFIMLISSFPSLNYIFPLRSQIKQKFNILLDYKLITLNSLLTAMEITNAKFD
ncbi:MAG: hypothetical protein K9I47_12280, partial [Bacteroidales bacterium]|nr:hypothetical protein [Bacteroidales bacterium]